MKHKQYSMLLGRFQCLPPHEGHLSLVRKLLSEGKNVLIALRKEDGTRDNPFTFEDRKLAFEKIFINEVNKEKVKIIEIDDVIEVVYGRKPGWEIREIRLDKKTEDISATKIRDKINSLEVWKFKPTNCKYKKQPCINHPGKFPKIEKDKKRK